MRLHQIESVALNPLDLWFGGGGIQLFILLGIFAPDEDMERNFPTLQRFQMLG